MSFPEDIVNQMSLVELQNCDWDSLFSQIEQSYRPEKRDNSTAYNEPYYYVSGVLESLPPNQISDLSHSMQQSHTSFYPHYQWGLYQTTFYGPFSTPYSQIKQSLISPKYSYNHGFKMKEDIVLARKPVYIPSDVQGNVHARKSGKVPIQILNDEREIIEILKKDGEIPGTIKSELDDDDDEDDEENNVRSRKSTFICKICEDIFLTKASLITHVKIHQQPFCKKCLKPFKTESNLQTHLRKFHPRNPNYDSDVNNNSSENENENSNDEKKSYLDDKYQISTKTVTSKYGRRRKVLDTSDMVQKKTRRSI